MPLINYHRYTEKDAEKVRMILGHNKGRMNPNRDVELSSDQVPSGEIEVNINVIGDKLPSLAGGALAHEFGHTAVFKKVWPTIKDRIAWEGVSDNYILHELIATYYSRAKSGDESIFRRSIDLLRKQYKEIKETNPGSLYGASFEDMKTEAAMIVMRDLGVDPSKLSYIKKPTEKIIYKAGRKNRPPKRLPSSLRGMN
jgi:hypothetical protein